MTRTAVLAAFALTGLPLAAQSGPRVLIVTAHPDDDAAFAGAVYQVTRQLDGVVDLALVTDGSGGFRYATLAIPIYGIDLTDEAVAREHLPRIRKQELMAGGDIVGIRKYFFLDQLDHQYTQDADTVLRHVWDSAAVHRDLARIMAREGYDMVFGLLPFPQNHGHHKAATMLAIHAAQSLPAGQRPVVLGGFPCAFGGTTLEFTNLAGYPVTTVTGGPMAEFDRTQTFGFNNRLNFQIIANWVIAEHKSQGTMQLLMNAGERECYWYFDVNGEGGRARVVDWFEQMNVR